MWGVVHFLFWAMILNFCTKTGFRRNWYEESSISDVVTGCVEKTYGVYDIKCFLRIWLMVRRAFWKILENQCAKIKIKF